MRSKLEIAFELDRRWRLLRGEMDGSKRAALIELARILAEARVPYAIIGGVALQIHQSDPRTTIDIDLAVLARDQIPRERLRKAGFRMKERFCSRARRPRNRRRTTRRGAASGGRFRSSSRCRA